MTNVNDIIAKEHHGKLLGVQDLLKRAFLMAVRVQRLDL